MTTTRHRLRNLRYLHNHRATARRATDIAYLFYLALLIIAILGAPLIHWITLQLAEPTVLAALTAPGQSAKLAGIALTLMLTAVMLGRLRGPVLPQPFRAVLLTATDLPRNRTLLPTFLLAGMLVLTLTLAIAAIFVGTLSATATISLATATALLILAAELGILLAVTWLAGQSLTGVPLAASVAAVTLSAGAGYGSYWLGGWPSLFATTILFTALAVAAVPALLRRLDAQCLIDSATKWQSASTASVVGDIRYAAGLFRQLPRCGRHLPAVGQPRQFLTLRSDLVALLRTPLRLITGTVFVTVGLTLVAYAPNLGKLAWLPGGGGLLVCYLACGIFADGFRHCAECVLLPPLYGDSVRRRYLAHLAMPALFLAIPGSVAIAIVGCYQYLAAAAESTLSGSLFLVTASGLIALFARAFDSAKGDMPAVILAPQPTLVGDVSSLSVLAWQADIIFLTTAAGGSLAYYARSGPTLGAFFLVCSALVSMAIGLERRIHSQTEV